MYIPYPSFPLTTSAERAKVRRASETTLHNTIFKAITFANAHKDHIPPITTTESNPFPYQIHIGGGYHHHQHHHPQQQQPLHHQRSNSNSGNGSSNNQKEPTTTSAGAAVRGLVGTAAGGMGAAATGWATRMGIY